MLGLEEAQRRLLALVRPLSPERVPISEAFGRAVLEGISAVRTLPPWDNSAMDGFAVRSADVIAPGTRLPVSQTIFAGSALPAALAPGTCARIMTGAPLPPGADAVEMQEEVTLESDGTARFHRTVPPGQFVRPHGEDIREGAPLIAPGAPLGPMDAARLWAQGLSEIDVPGRPRVAVLSTGDELREVGAPLEAHALADVNGPLLCALIQKAGGIAVPLGVAPDSEDAIVEALSRAADCDLVLTSAGVSVGEKDFVRSAFQRIGVELDFWRVAIKPGKPLAVGRWGPSRTIVGLPGNPVSAWVTFTLFVRPLLRRMLGWGEAKALPVTIEGRSAVAVPKPPGLTHLVRVVAVQEKGVWVATPLATQNSGALRSAAGATHLMVIPEVSPGIAPGETVVLLPLSWD